MSKISLVAKLTAVEGKQAELEEAFADLIEVSTIEEGLEVYSVHRTDEPGVYYFFEIYRDDDAMGAHGKSDEMKAAMRRVGALLSGAPEVTVMSPVAAKGLEL